MYVDMYAALYVCMYVCKSRPCAIQKGICWSIQIVAFFTQALYRAKWSASLQLLDPRYSAGGGEILSLSRILGPPTL